MRKKSNKIVIIVSSLVVLIGLSVIIVMINNQPETSPADKQTDDNINHANENYSHTENDLQEAKEDNTSSTDDKSITKDDNNDLTEDNLLKSEDNSEENESSKIDANKPAAEGSTFQVKEHNYQVLSSSQKSVALINTTQHNGDFVVPSKVTYNNHTYTVTQVGGASKEINILDADESRYYTYYNGAFSDKEFSSITLPKSIRKIADYSFYGISNLQKVTINSDEITIGKYAISNISGLMFEERTLNINAKKVTLEEGALSGALMTSININADVLSVGDYALALAPKGIKLPQGTTSIGNYAFDGCTGTFTIPKNVSSIGEGAFYKMKLNLEEDNKYFKISDGILYNIEGTEIIRAFDLSGAFSIPSTVTSINQYAFAYSNVTEVTTSENMNKIPDYAFYQCAKLTSITVTEGIETIGNYAFYGNKLTHVSLPNTLSAIGDHSFLNNKSLTSINLPHKITSVGTRAFYRTSITEVRIPASVAEIGREAFGLFLGAESSLGVSIIFDEGNNYYEQKDNIIYEKGTSNILMMILNPNSESILIPEGLEQIGYINFINFNQEMQLVIPNTVTTIDTKIFSYYIDPEDIGIVRFIGTEAPTLKVDEDTKFHIYALASIVGKASYEKAFSVLPNKNIQTVSFKWY